ncbi:MAG: rRNA pseudouridine synthase [Candidatus Eremiobacteraeota bacterium]|nr:rRNA pseudouridine synthase [Candidatus Eremiobacteraeota bacterium]
MAQAGVASRREADALIAGGRVVVNGCVMRELGTQVRAEDRIEVNGAAIKPTPTRVYLVLHKPPGVVTTLRDPQGRRTIADLLPAGPRVVPVGRLDYDTSGVLLLTNDGELTNKLLHPRFGVEKRYRATIAGRLDERAVHRLREGVRLDGGRTAPAAVRVVAVRRDRSIVDLTLHEGRNRQVRRMFEALGHPVYALTRLRFGPVALGQLPAGRVRKATGKERAALERIRRT